MFAAIEIARSEILISRQGWSSPFQILEINDSHSN